MSPWPQQLQQLPAQLPLTISEVAWTLRPLLERFSSQLSFMMVFLEVFMKPQRLWTKDRLLCILAENCDEAAYKKLVQALCQEHQIPLLTVPDNMQLGKYAGLCKLDAEGNERKVVRCSSVAIRDWGKESPAHDVVTEYIKSQKA